MSDFKQAVEEIANKRYCTKKICKQYDEWCGQCQTDRILAAHNKRLDEIAEGMPKADITWDGSQDVCDWAVSHQLKDCQAHVKAQKEGM
jgi:hypothetical protein